MDAKAGFVAFLSPSNQGEAVALPCPRGTLCALKDPVLGKGVLPPNPQQVHFALMANGESRRVEWPFNNSEEGGSPIMFWLLPEGCKEGFFLESDTCIPCPNGTSSRETGALDAGVCQPCTEGSFTAAQGQTSCTDCPVGTFVAERGASTCIACSPGDFQDDTGGRACKACRPGTFSAGPAAEECTPCPPGTAQGSMGAHSCNACDASEYSSTGDTRCLPCGQTPDLDGVCQSSPVQEQPPHQSVWVAVGGLAPAQPDECLAVANSSLGNVRSFRLHAQTRCKHRLRVAGNGFVSEAWTDPVKPVPPRTLQVVPYNDTFYPTACRRQGFGAWFVLRDRSGMLVAPPDNSSKAWMSILDPASKNLLYQAVCQNHSSCYTTRFCPTMSVLVRIRLHAGQRVLAEGSSLVFAGEENPCLPVSSWTLGLHLQDPGQAFFPGSSQKVSLVVLNAPSHVKAFQATLKIQAPFSFVDFAGTFPAVVTDNPGELSLQMDTSKTAAPLNQLGVLTVMYKHDGLTGINPAVQVLSAQFMLLRGNWLSTGIQTQGFLCRRDGILSVLVDHPRPTSLIVSASRQTLIQWQALQAGANVWPASISAVGVWNVPETLRTVQPTCTSLTPHLLSVQTCAHVEPVGVQDGEGRVLVEFQGVQAVQFFDVTVPALESIRFFPFVVAPVVKGRLLVTANVLGIEVDATPMLASGLDELECAENSVVTVLDQPISCQHPPFWPPYLLSGAWTAAGSFVVHPPVLSPLTDPVVVVDGRFSTGSSADTSRANFLEDRLLHLMRTAATPRCVQLVSGLTTLSVPVVPPAPARLHVKLTRTILATQQDFFGFVPKESRIADAFVLFSDGTSASVLGDPRLTVRPDPDFFLPSSPDGIQTRFRNGSAYVSFAFAGIPCLSARVLVQVFESSVASSRLLCIDCPDRLSQKDDPLSLEWPGVYPATVPASSFVVRHSLVDNTTWDEWTPLQVAGLGAVYDKETILASESDLIVSTDRSGQESVVIPVVERWAVQARLLCNGQACSTLEKLAPAGDLASQPPFLYLSRVNLTWDLLLFNGTKLEVGWLPQVAVLANSTPLPDITELALSARGETLLRVVFGPDWKLDPPQVDSTVQVHALESLRLEAPTTLHRIHCTHAFESAPVSLSGVLSDGFERSVNGGNWSWEGVVDLVSGVLHAREYGKGVIRVTLGELHLQHAVEVVVTSRLYTSYRLPESIPLSLWKAPIGATIRLEGELVPAMHVQNTSWVHERVVRWVASEPEIIDFPTSTTMRLLSDFYGQITITAVIRGCQGSEPITFDRAMRVNIVPDRTGQVDFGDELGPPLQAVAPGQKMRIQLFLFSLSPLLGYTGKAILPGLRLDADCERGELPFSLCVVSQDRGHIQLGASFPQSQRYGRVHIGTIQGTVELHAIARLQVSIESAVFEENKQFQATYGFAVQLGSARTSTLQLVRNTMHPKAQSLLATPGWNDAPSKFRASSSATPLLVAAPDSLDMARLFPTTFSAGLIAASKNQALSHTDPRLQAAFDDELLRFDPSSGVWSVQAGARGVASITFRYTQPETLKTQDFAVSVVFAQAEQVFLSPDRGVELARLHCSETFESRQLIASFKIFQNTKAIPLNKPSPLTSFRVEPDGLASVDPQTQTVRGLRPGAGTVLLSAFGLETSLPITVLNTSVLVTALRLPSPYLLSGARERLSLKGTLAGGSTILQDLSFLEPDVAIAQDTSPVAEITSEGGTLSLQGLRNTHPSRPCVITVKLNPCARQAALIASSALVVRLQPQLSTRQPADIVVTPGKAGFQVTLRALNPVSSLILTLQTDASRLKNWRAGPSLPASSEVSLDYPVFGQLILAAIFPQPVLEAALFTLEPMPASIQGYLDTTASDGTSSYSPIIAGAFGQKNVSTPPQGRPVVNSNTLARAADSTTLFRLATGKARMIEPVLYSNDREFSAMFRVMDHYLQPDDNLSALEILFHTTELLDLLLPLGGARVVEGVGVTVPALLVADGWYALQSYSAVPLPRIVVRVSYRLTTVAGAKSSTVQAETLDEPFTVGRELHACPRYTADKGVFKLLYRMRIPPPPDLQGTLACVAHVVPRRVEIWGPVVDGAYMFSIMLESFIRMHQAHEDIMNHSSFAWHQEGRRLLQTQPLLERVGLTYVNDTADQPIPCPAGMFFSSNGTYDRLPLHAIAGPDCYGLRCGDGYVLLGTTECAPAAVSMDVIWICSIVILSGMVLLCCIFCALYVSRMRTQTVEDVDLSKNNNMHDDHTQSARHHSTDPFEDDDDNDGSFKNIITGMYLDEYSASMLDDDFSCIPIDDEQFVKR